MSFYSSIAGWYDRIFPFDEDLIPFLMTVFPEGPLPDGTSPGSVAAAGGPGRSGRILDIGCATGALANALGSRSLEVVGIDLDPEMIRLAKGKYQNTRVSFQIGNMAQLARLFGPEAFTGVACFGNTIVHLCDPVAIGGLFRQVFRILQPGGVFAGQIIHYDRILRERAPGLPTIERGGIRFERRYRYPEGDPTPTRGGTGPRRPDGAPPADSFLMFETVLTDLATGKQVPNQIPLYPLKAGELRTALTDAGFAEFRFFQDTDRTELTDDSYALYFAAEKPAPGETPPVQRKRVSPRKPPRKSQK